MLRDMISNEWFTIFIFTGLVMITISKYLYSNRFSDFIPILANSKYLKLYSKDQKFIDGFDTLLFVNVVISLSVFSFLAHSTLINKVDFDLIEFLKLLFAIASLFIIKVLIERLIGSLFEIDKLINSYLFQKISYLNYSGLLLLPINALLLYTLNPSKLIIYIVIGIVVFINIIGFISSFKNHQKLILSNLFYFILYLCALEIGPYLILFKLITEY